MSEGKTPPPRDAQRVREREPLSQGALDMRLDAALGDWPMPVRSAIDWDEAAERIQDRIDAGDRGHSQRLVSDEDLLKAPLAESTEEAQSSAVFEKGASRMAQTERSRDRRSFQELANMARNVGATPSPSSVSGLRRADAESSASVAPVAPQPQKEDSGILDLAALAAADPGAPARAQATPLAAQGLFEDEAREAPAHPAPPAAAAVPAPAQAAAQPALAKPAKPEKKGGAGFLLVGGFVAAAAIAAGAFVMIKGRSHDSGQIAAAPPVATQQQQTPAKPVAPSPTTQSTDNAVDPNALPLANAPTATTALPFAPNAPATTGLLPFAPSAPKPEAVASASAAPAPSAAATAAPSASVAANGPAPAGSTTDKSLEDQMRQAAGPSTSATTSSTPLPGAVNDLPANIPLKPSQGAVSGAIGAVLPSARQCLGPDDPVSQATIVFQSNGSVQSVSVTGGAAGKPAEACIKLALKNAKVAPFAQATFSASATIRPL